MKYKNSVRTLIYMAMYITLTIIGNKVVAIPYPTLRISFGFLPLMACGYQLGIQKTMLVAVVADVIGVLLFPSGGAYFVGWTLTAAWSGFVYGTLHNKTITYPRIIKTVVIESLITTSLNSLWLYIIMGNAIYADLPIRFSKLLVTIPVQIIMGKVILLFMEKEMRKY